MTYLIVEYYKDNFELLNCTYNYIIYYIINALQNNVC